MSSETEDGDESDEEYDNPRLHQALKARGKENVGEENVGVKAAWVNTVGGYEVNVEGNSTEDDTKPHEEVLVSEDLEAEDSDAMKCDITINEEDVNASMAAVGDGDDVPRDDDVADEAEDIADVVDQRMGEESAVDRKIFAQLGLLRRDIENTDANTKASEDASDDDNKNNQAILHKQLKTETLVRSEADISKLDDYDNGKSPAKPRSKAPFKVKLVSVKTKTELSKGPLDEEEKDIISDSEQYYTTQVIKIAPISKVSGRRRTPKTIFSL